MPLITSVLCSTCTLPESKTDRACNPARTRSVQPVGRLASGSVATKTLSAPKRALAKLITTFCIKLSPKRPRNSALWVLGSRVAVNSAVAKSAETSAFSAILASSENTSGSVARSDPTALSKLSWLTVSAAKSVMSASENVTVPAPIAASAAIDSEVACAHEGLGTPMPTVQVKSPLAPAATAAAKIRSRAASVSAEQASNRAPPASITKRKVKGVKTGRGAVISVVTTKPCGAAWAKTASNWRFSTSDPAIAMIATPSAEIEILALGSSCSAVTPKLSASSQSGGAG